MYHISYMLASSLLMAVRHYECHGIGIIAVLRYVTCMCVGMVDLSLGIQVQLESDIQADIPQFTLYAESTGGPLTNVVWSLDGASINSSYSFSSSVLMDSQLAKYGLFLRVEGRLTGLYRVIVSNNRPSMATRAVNVYGEYHGHSHYM